MTVELRRDDDRYLVILDGEVITEVYRARVKNRTRYPYGDPHARMQGAWRWQAGNVDDDEFMTRREAVAEAVRRAQIQRQEGPS